MTDVNDDPSPSAGTSFEAWLDNPASGSTTWVIAGRSRSGKTTLVENLLGLENISKVTSSDAKRIEVYSHNVGNSELKIVEIPGLDCIVDQNESTITNRLQSLTGGEADILLYCVSIDPSSKLDDSTEGKTINLLTAVFKKQVWERAILVFTFADYTKERHVRNPVKIPTMENVVEDYAQKFEKILKVAGIGSFTVLPLCHARDSKLGLFQEIPALPTGERLNTKLLANVKWEEHLCMEMLSKCSLKAVPIFINIIGKNQLSSGTIINRRAIRALCFGLAAASFLYLIATRCSWEMTSMTRIMLGVNIIGGILALFGTDAPTRVSLARSIAQIRFRI